MPLDPRYHDAESDRLHLQLLARAPDSDEAACAYLRPRLVRRLRRHRFRFDDPQLVESAVDDVLSGYVRSPEKFDESRGDLLSWLLQSARNRRCDLRRSDRQRIDREIGIDVTRLEGRAPVDERAVIRQRVHDLVAMLPDPSDRAFLEARLRDESLQVQAAALGVQTDGEQATRIVARAWDRIRKWLQRHVASRPKSA